MLVKEKVKPEDKVQSGKMEKSFTDVGVKPKASRRVVRKKPNSASAKNDAQLQESSSFEFLNIEESITVSDAIGSSQIKSAGTRDELVLAQNATALMRRQEALFRQANVLLAQIPESRREGVRQAVLVYARSVRAWQMQAKEQETAFLSAQQKDQSARVNFVSARNGLSGKISEAKKRHFGFPFFRSRQKRSEVLNYLEQVEDQTDLIREALHQQGLAIHRYIRFQSEWRNSMEEMMAFISEQMG